ncbi:hypothetical protein DXG01_016485 [Tephrocybe rancida]|nr:hypothetical protein DXG01_016485 [Tephrocybe rancida]
MLILSRRFSSGAFVSLINNPMMELGATDDVGRRLGMFMSIFALGALAGPPISGAINAATGRFEEVGYYADQNLGETPQTPMTDDSEDLKPATAIDDRDDAIAEKKSLEAADSFPDGGFRAWLVVSGVRD